MTNIQGGCLCGAVRYVANEEPLVTRECWCRVCQFLACGNSTINLAFRRQAVKITGDPRDYPSIAESGRHMHRRFCPNCGVHLFSEAEERPEMIVVRAGTLDAPANIVVDAIIWTSSAPAWARLNPDLPHFEKQPPPPVARGEGRKE